MTRSNESVFERSWRKYAIAGTALLAAPAVEAAVITSGPLNLSLSVTNTSDILGFDFDGNDFPDLSIGVFDFDDGDGGINRGVVANGNIVLTSPNSPFFAKALGGGAAIDANADFSEYYGYLLKDVSGNSNEAFTAQALQGEWPNDINRFRFLGFRFFNFVDESTHYGWMKIAVQLGSADASIVEWAYEDEDRAGIATPGDVPEPSSLALLALGAAGVAALKRRRKQ